MKWLIVLGLAFLTACQHRGIPIDTAESPNLRVGSILNLNQTLEFTPGYSRSFIQFGQPVRFNQIKKYHPYCQFYRYDSALTLHSLRFVEADQFTVLNIRKSLDNPASGNTIMSGIMTSSRPHTLKDVRDETLSTIIKIESAKQPDIKEIRCSIDDKPIPTNYLNHSQILQVLGDTVTLVE